MNRLFLLMFASLFFISGATSQQQRVCNLTVATYNLRMDNPDDNLNAWPHRKELVKGLIRFHDFDVFGTQEGFYHQLQDLLELDEYAYIGVGRGDGKTGDEHSAIFYKKERFELLDKGDFWYSERPDMPGKGWDATCCNRICSWGKFKDRVSGKVFFFFNSHFDHEGHIARKNSSLLLLQKIEEIAGDTPVFCTGDFNATPEQEPIRILSESKKLFDSYVVTAQPPYGTTGTFTGFNPKSSCSDRIDYIWITKTIAVEKYGVLNEMPYGRFPSDHFPVMIKAHF